jgi:hypothetical protein
VHKTLDAAFPPASCPPGIAGVLGYTGGPRATNVWNPRQWLPYQHVRQFPIFVADLRADPARQGSQAVEQAFTLGWTPYLEGAARRAVIIDVETGADPAWYKVIADAVYNGGYVPVAYGSLSTVLGNAARDLLVADWNDVPVIPAGQTIHGVQYKAEVPLGNTTVDYAVIDDWLLNRGGIGPRKQPH